MSVTLIRTKFKKVNFISRCTRDCILAENMPKDEGSWDTANGVENLQK